MEHQQPPATTQAQISSPIDPSDTELSESFGVSRTQETAKELLSRNYPMYFKVLLVVNECSENLR